MNMKILVYSIVILLIITAIVGCNNDLSSDNIPKESELKQLIIESLSIKSNNYDTIHYEYRIPICGNSTKEELNLIYNPLLNINPFDSILGSKLKAIILTDLPFNEY